MLLRTLALIAAVFLPAMALGADRECEQSPSKIIKVCVFAKDGGAFYEVSRLGKPVLAPAALGLSFAGEPAARITSISTAKTLNLGYALGAALGRAARHPRQPHRIDGLAGWRHAAGQDLRRDIPGVR